MDESEKVNVIDIKIIPNRYLKPDTTEKLLNSIYSINSIKGILWAWKRACCKSHR